MIWNSNLNESKTEELVGIQESRIATDIYITDKPDIKRLPEDKPKLSKKEQKEMDKTMTKERTSGGEKKPPILTAEKDVNVLGNRDQKGPTYRMLKPEVKQTLDKLVY